MRWSFDEAMQKLEPNESSYIVIVTRGHRDDMRILRWAVQTRARYVGMIGSKRKVIEIFKTLQAEGLPAHLFDRVHAPDRTRYWRGYSGGNCSGDHGRVDRHSPPCDVLPCRI